MTGTTTISSIKRIDYNKRNQHSLTIRYSESKCSSITPLDRKQIFAQWTYYHQLVFCMGSAIHTLYHWDVSFMNVWRHLDSAGPHLTINKGNKFRVTAKNFSCFMSGLWKSNQIQSFKIRSRMYSSCLLCPFLSYLSWFYREQKIKKANQFRWDWEIAKSILIWKRTAAFIIIIIMKCCEHVFPWLSLSIRLYRPSHSVGPLDYILCLYRAVVDKL